MINIAIDGPAGSGKSTLAKNVAHKFNILYLDTGAMYRAIALSMKNNNIDVENEKSVIEQLNKINLEIKYINSVQHVLLDGRDVTKDIRANDISMLASTVSKIMLVRQKLVEMQREIAAKNDCVLDGRDIGTYVLPNAALKIFLIATPEIRAQRRKKELTENGINVEYEVLLNEIKARDLQDSSRDFAPLKQADDAVVIDTSNNTIEETFKKAVKLITKLF
ncbi:MAG: (d)CMP kinase [Christensenellales bacterium]|jgi:cytidylate kinase|nr:(d)CMP kinase [Clostridiales bacterium]